MIDWRPLYTKDTKALRGQIAALVRFARAAIRENGQRPTRAKVIEIMRQTAIFRSQHHEKNRPNYNRKIMWVEVFFWAECRERA